MLELARAGARPRSQFHRRCRGGRPARAVARRDRARCSPIRRCAAGRASGSRCRPIRSAPPAVIDWLADTARALGRRLMVRLVKGAYWDTEVKRAQERGLADYPVFTRKAMTDLCYLACARKLLAARPRLYPQFATHNALTVASVIEDAGGVDGFEFQRLHGMGEALYEALLRRAAGRRLPRLCAGRRPPRPARLSGAAASGERRQLVVRRRSRPIRRCRSRRSSSARRAGSATRSTRAIRRSRCRAISMRPARRNSRGRRVRRPREPRRAARRGRAAPTCRARRRAARRRHRRCRASSARSRSPIDGAAIGTRARRRRGDRASPRWRRPRPASPAWSATPVEDARRGARARRPICIEAAPRPPDRAAAARGRQDARRRARRGARGGRFLPLLRRRGAPRARRRSRCRARPARATSCAIAAAACSSASARGIFRWRSSSARSTAALAAGNAVVAKPAEQTPLIAAEAVRLLHAAGVPASALHLVPGDGKVGAALVARSARRRRRLHRLDRGRRGRSTARSPPRTGRSCR